MPPPLADGECALGAEAALTTGDGAFSHCLGIPAGAHTKAELFQLIAASGGTAAKFSVLDATGRKVRDHAGCCEYARGTFTVRAAERRTGRQD